MDPISGLRLANMVPNGLPPLEAQKSKIGSIPTQELSNLGSINTPQTQGVEKGRSFSDFLGQMTHEVNAKQAAASDAVQGLLSGQNVPLHSAVLAVEEASVSFQLMVEVRNKLLDSYQELMRMQI
jgi:flagellar hook-basal body complex protein FliE